MSLRAAHSRARDDIAASYPACAGAGAVRMGRLRRVAPRASIRRSVNVLALYDIHGNLDALEAVLRAAPAPDLVLVGGDAVPGPFGAATLDRLQQLPTRWVRGNGEREVAAGVGAATPAPDDPAAVAAAITAAELGGARARALGDLPL